MPFETHLTFDNEKLEWCRKIL